MRPSGVTIKTLSRTLISICSTTLTPYSAKLRKKIYLPRPPARIAFLGQLMPCQIMLSIDDIINSLRPKVQALKPFKSRCFESRNVMAMCFQILDFAFKV